VAGYQPIKKRAYSREMLLYCWLFKVTTKKLDVSCNMDRFDSSYIGNIIVLTPGKEPATRPVIGVARVSVSDCNNEKFEKSCSFRGMIEDGRDE
jgi:hypothetical protein